MTPTVRIETPDDLRAVRHVNRFAFRRDDVNHPTERRPKVAGHSPGAGRRAQRQLRP